MMPLPRCVRADASPGPEWREIGWFAVYERPVGEPADIPSVKLMQPREASLVRSIAEHFEHDRLHMDPEVSDRDADFFKLDIVNKAIAKDWPILTYGVPTKGFLIVRPEPPVAHIDLIGVAPKSRRSGIGTFLMHAFLSWAAKEGFETCRAGTMEANNAACCLYEAAGFKRIETCKIFHFP